MKLLQGTGAKPVPSLANGAGENESSGWPNLDRVDDARFTQSFVQLAAAGSLSTLVTTE
jgi:hypothetical protein